MASDSPSILRRLIGEASNANTSRWRLEAFAHDEQLLEHVLRNTNVTPSLFFEHGMKNPEAVAENPMLPILAVTDPHFLARLVEPPERRGARTLFDAILAVPACPPSLLEIALKHLTPARARALLANPATPSSVLTGLEVAIRAKQVSGVRIRDVRCHANHPHGVNLDPRKTLEAEFDKADVHLPNDLQFRYRRLRLPTWVEEKMLNNSPQQLARIAGSPDVLRVLVRDGDTQTLVAVSRNRETPLDALEHILDRVREQHPFPDHGYSPPLTNGEKTLLSNLMQHPNVTSELLHTLFEWGQNIPAIAKPLARHEATPPEVLRVMAQRPDVASRVLLNPSASPGVLRLAYQHAPDDERGQGMSNPNLPPDVVERFYWHLLGSLYPEPFTIHSCLNHANLPRACFEDAVEQPDRNVRKAAAGSPVTPLDLLERLQVDPDPRVREYLLRNKTIPGAWCEAFLDDPDKSVRHEAARRLGRRLDGGNVRKRTRMPSAREQLFSAVAVDLSPQYAERLARSVAPTVRLALALNPACPAHVLERLRHDPSTLVARGAQEELERRHATVPPPEDHAPTRPAR